MENVADAGIGSGCERLVRYVKNRDSSKVKMVGPQRVDDKRNYSNFETGDIPSDLSLSIASKPFSRSAECLFPPSTAINEERRGHNKISVPLPSLEQGKSQLHGDEQTSFVDPVQEAANIRYKNLLMKAHHAGSIPQEERRGALSANDEEDDDRDNDDWFALRRSCSRALRATGGEAPTQSKEKVGEHVDDVLVQRRREPGHERLKNQPLRNVNTTRTVPDHGPGGNVDKEDKEGNRSACSEEKKDGAKERDGGVESTVNSIEDGVLSEEREDSVMPHEEVAAVWSSSSSTGQRKSFKSAGQSSDEDEWLFSASQCVSEGRNLKELELVTLCETREKTDEDKGEMHLMQGTAKTDGRTSHALGRLNPRDDEEGKAAGRGDASSSSSPTGMFQSVSDGELKKGCLSDNDTCPARDGGIVDVGPSKMNESDRAHVDPGHYYECEKEHDHGNGSVEHTITADDETSNKGLCEHTAGRLTRRR